VGWTDICDRPYAETVAALREVGREIYSRGSRRTGGRVPTHVKNDSTKNERNNGK
jgi:hypothetical protein